MLGKNVKFQKRRLTKKEKRGGIPYSSSKWSKQKVRREFKKRKRSGEKKESNSKGFWLGRGVKVGNAQTSMSISRGK